MTADAQLKKMAAQIDADLGAAPISRAKMDLLWLGPGLLSMLKPMVAGGRTPVIAGADADTQGMVNHVMSELRAGRLTDADLAWAQRVDGIAGAAENLARADDLIGAIDEFRKALKMAPCCDVYLMSMASCFSNLGMLPEALRYIQRAAEINPTNARIKRNVAGIREHLE